MLSSSLRNQYVWSLNSNCNLILYPVEVALTGTNLEMILCNAEVHLCVADKRRSFLCQDLRLLAFSVKSNILEVELLLVDGGRGEQGSLHTIIEPTWSDVTGIAYIFR